MMANRSSLFRRYSPLVAAYVAIVAVTQYAYFGDTPGYVANVLRFDRDPKLGVKDFWDFGHLLWRPSAWLLYRAIGRFSPYAKSGEDNLTVTASMIAMSLLASFLTVLLFRSLAGRFLASDRVADFVTVAFLCFHSMLNFLHSGASYIPGLMWLTLSLWAMLRAVESQQQGSKYAALAGAGAGLALLYWFPYMLAIPGILAAAVLWPPEQHGSARPGERFHLAATAILFAGLLVIPAYGLALIQLHFGSVDAVKQWVSASSHGWVQNRRVLRLITGLPRSFVWMGDEGLLLKRYFFHDPYARVTMLQVAGELWRVLAFYLFVSCLLWVLPFRAAGRRVLVLLAACAVPLLLFAIFVFEPGSIERYLPVYPFLCLAVAYALSRFREHRWPVTGMAAFLCVAICLNVKAMWKTPLISAEHPAIVRARSLKNKVEPTGLIALLSLRDELYMWPGAHPFDMEMRHAVLPVYDVFEPGTQRALEWKQHFARRAMDSLQQSSRVWISKRLLAARPLPEWGWTEGDDPHLTWPDVQPFFTRFQYSADTGGPDGFIQLAPSSENLTLLNRILSSPV